MEFVIALCINLLVIALIIAIIFWILGMFAEEIPPRIFKIIKAIIILLVLLWLLQVIFGQGPSFYPLPAHTK